MGALVPTSVAATALGVTPDAIRLLRHRGKLTRHGTKQRALVDLDELTTLTDATNTEPTPHGRGGRWPTNDPPTAKAPPATPTAKHEPTN